MKKIRIYHHGELIAEFKNVNGLLVQKDGRLEVLEGMTWIDFEKETGYDWFCIM